MQRHQFSAFGAKLRGKSAIVLADFTMAGEDHGARLVDDLDGGFGRNDAVIGPCCGFATSFELFGADAGDDLDEYFHTLDQPRQFFSGDEVFGGIAGIDIGAIGTSKAASGKFGITRPCLDQPWGP